MRAAARISGHIPPRGRLPDIGSHKTVPLLRIASSKPRSTLVDRYESTGCQGRSFVHDARGRRHVCTSKVPLRDRGNPTRSPSGSLAGSNWRSGQPSSRIGGRSMPVRGSPGLEVMRVVGNRIAGITTSFSGPTVLGGADPAQGRRRRSARRDGCRTRAASQRRYAGSRRGRRRRARRNRRGSSTKRSGRSGAMGKMKGGAATWPAARNILTNAGGWVRSSGIASW